MTSGGLHVEANLSTEPSEAEALPRFPCADAYGWWPSYHQRASGQGPEAPGRFDAE